MLTHSFSVSALCCTPRVGGALRHMDSPISFRRTLCGVPLSQESIGVVYGASLPLFWGFGDLLLRDLGFFKGFLYIWFPKVSFDPNLLSLTS